MDKVFCSECKWHKVEYSFNHFEYICTNPAFGTVEVIPMTPIFRERLIRHHGEANCYVENRNNACKFFEPIGEE